MRERTTFAMAAACLWVVQNLVVFVFFSLSLFQFFKIVVRCLVATECSECNPCVSQYWIHSITKSQAPNVNEKKNANKLCKATKYVNVGYTCCVFIFGLFWIYGTTNEHHKHTSLAKLESKIGFTNKSMWHGKWSHANIAGITFNSSVLGTKNEVKINHILVVLLHALISTSS